MTNETTKQNERKLFRAAILTPYLLENFEDMKAEGRDEDYIKAQVEEFGFDPNNLRDVRVLKTGNLDVILETPQNHTLFHPAMADLIVMGNTEKSEGDVRNLVQVNPGLIIARYSVFYGNPSEYTRNKPEDVGYSLDLNKKVSIARALLTHEQTLNAILARDETQIRKAVANLNSGIERPVIITPYLTKALEAKR